MKTASFHLSPDVAFEAPQKIHAFCKNLLPCNRAVTTVTHLLIRSPLQTMIRKFLSAVFLLAASTFAQAQVPNSPIKITDIKATLEQSPEYTIGIGPQRKAKSQSWLWVEVAFAYNGGRGAQPIDDLTVNYYILLNNVGPQNPTGTLLVGSVTHTGVVPGTDVHHSLALVSPQTLNRYFNGTPPSSPSAAFRAIGVTIAVQGQIQSEQSIGLGKGQPQWWNRFQQGPPGLVLNKDQTPFAPLFYDYFEAIKSKAAGY